MGAIECLNSQNRNVEWRVVVVDEKEEEMGWALQLGVGRTRKKRLLPSQCDWLNWLSQNCIRAMQASREVMTDRLRPALTSPQAS